MIERILAAWCRNMHDGAMWPMHGKYICRKCLREHVVEWERHAAAPSRSPRALRSAPASMDVCA
ncbi:MAG TPA: hypothetical protein VMH28_10065 [Candidatus Acidoferrales bacterium]|nr:hypothetical protein [Candidatus Acidoferrales bacterium]